MKKLLQFSFKAFIALCILSMPLMMYGQETEPQEEPTSKEEKKADRKARNASFDPYFFINANLGALLYHGDITNSSFIPATDTWNLGYGAMLGYQFCPVFGLRLQYQGGKLNGYKNEGYVRISNVTYDWQFETDKLMGVNLNGNIHLSNLIGGYNPDRVVSFRGIVGIGYFSSESKLIDNNTNQEVQEINYPMVDPGDLPAADSRSTYYIPTGIGIDFRLTEKVDLNLESTVNFTGTDDVDNYIDNAMKVFNDFYSYTSLGVTYKFMASTSLKKMVSEYENVKYELTPDPLEYHGGDVTLTVKGTIPESYFNKKAAVKFAPVLKWDGGEYQLGTKYLQGEKVIGDGVVITYAEGGTFTYTETIPYEEGMEASELVVYPIAFIPPKEGLEDMSDQDIIDNLKYAALGETKLGDGVIITPLRIMHDEDLLHADRATAEKLRMDLSEYYELETMVSEEAVIFFKVNLHKLNWKLPLNKDPLAMELIAAFEEFAALGWDIKNIEIDAWASPEGEERFNQGLSERRSQTGQKYVIDLYKQLIKAGDFLLEIADPETEITYNVRWHGEDWDGFMRAMEESNIADKNVILNVVRSQPNVIQREEEIRNMALVYKEIEDDILPPLRRAVLKINAFEPKKSDGEISTLALTDPSALSDKELLYAGTLTDDLDTKLQIYTTHMEMYPDDWKGYNNAGWVLLNQWELEEAAPLLEIANDLYPNNPMVINNLGALAAKSKDYELANDFYAEAKKLGAPEGYNMGMLMIPAGDYGGAVSSLNRKCNYNTALAKMLNGDHSGANTCYNCIEEPNAKVYYMLAVLGARMENSEMMFENLTKAITAAEKVKPYILVDREFVDYWNDPNFQALAQ